ncbi:MAG: diguanylate cyclase [Sulfuricurvum sp.]|nr:diguanylate cyclase [Sulfuricurvum sp.]
MVSPSKMTLLKRTLLWLFAIATVTFITLVFIGLEVRNAIRENGLSRMDTILKHKIKDIEIYVHERYTALDNLKQLFYFASRHHRIFERGFWEDSSGSLQKSVHRITRENEFYDVFVINVDGDIVYTVKEESDLHTNLSTGRYADTELAKAFRNALEKKEAYISDFHFYEPSHDFAAFMAEPIEDNGTVIGVIAVQIDNKTIQKVINDYTELGKTGDVIATVDRQGKIMSVSTTRFGNIPAYTFFDRDKRIFIDQAAKGKQGQMYTVDHAGHDVAVAWGYQQDLRMGIAVKIDQDELLQEWYQQIATLFILFISGVAVVIWMVAMAIRSFAKPIQHLTQNALKISQGNYTLDLKSDDYDSEWQFLIHIFNQMVLETQNKIHQLNTQKDELLAYKEEIDSLNKRLSEKIEIKTRQVREYVNIIDQNVITSQTNINGDITYASDAFCKISGYTREELIGENHRIIRHPDMKREFFVELWKTITAGETWRGEIKNRKADGGYYWVDTTISPNIEEGKITGFTAIRHDITNQKLIEELSITDSLTGLYNRRHYAKTIQEEMNRVRRHNTSLALMMIDVDYFKLYNDTYGHQAGDEVLIRVADVLKMYTSRSGEYAFRMGGEEFAVLVSDMTHEEYLSLGRRIGETVEQLALPHIKNEVSSYVTISLGITEFYGNESIDCEQLYKDADTQLYVAKESGRNRVMMQQERIPPL